MAEIELVNDGSADPTLGCVPLIGFTPGNIALVERGVCEFGTKGVHAQNAGATAMVIANDGRCGACAHGGGRGAGQRWATMRSLSTRASVAVETSVRIAWKGSRVLTALALRRSRITPAS